MKKVILCIAGRSAIAREIIPALAHDHTVITAGRTACDVYCDVTRPLKFPKNIDTVLNFAASFGGSQNSDFEQAVQTNTLGLLRICAAAREAGVRHIVHLSSILTVHDELSSPQSLYALTKKHADELAMWYCNRNALGLTILRPSRVYGDNSSFARHQPFLFRIAKLSRAGEDIGLFGKHDPARNYIHCSDLSEIVRRVVKRQVEGVFNCTHPSNCTYTQIANAAQSHTKLGGNVYFMPQEPDIPDDNFPLDNPLYHLIDFGPIITIEEGITRIIDRAQFEAIQ